ncbi:MAG: Dabb family protein [Planctomycetia bacterium]|nr:Dabb family protein [Planctomycetia bacterium]
MLVHNVYFALHDAAPAARKKLLAACDKYLTQHPGIVYFACGELAQELNREVNDRAFDVALHIVFTNQAAHDQYQDAPTHHQFIEENRANWKHVRVFDSTCAPAGKPT